MQIKHTVIAALLLLPFLDCFSIENKIVVSF